MLFFFFFKYKLTKRSPVQFFRASFWHTVAGRCLGAAATGAHIRPAIDRHLWLGRDIRRHGARAGLWRRISIWTRGPPSHQPSGGTHSSLGRAIVQ